MYIKFVGEQAEENGLQLRNFLLPGSPEGSTPTQLTHRETINHWFSHTI